MTTNPTAEVNHVNSLGGSGGFIPRRFLVGLATLWFVVLTAITGCQTQTAQFKEPVEQASGRSQAISLREGDVVKISFPGAPNLNTTQQIRNDGKMDLPLVGELKAAGMAPDELQKELVKRYSSQLVSKEVTVTVESSSFPVYVTGAVLRPGKIMSSRPITALEAIMEAGGVDYAKANLKAVKVTRLEEGQFKTYTLNLKLALEGKETKPFYLKPSDIVKVPERFSLF